LIASDANRFDRPFRRAHAAGDVAGLQGRAGRARKTRDPTPVQQRDLGVGADVQRQHCAALALGGDRQQQRGVVPADEARYVPECVDATARCGVQSQLACLDVGGAGRDRNERRLAELRHRVAPQQMLHHRVAGDDQVHDARRRLIDFGA
jgi:hypothetical protein